jgi:hypothetical protein
VSPQLRRTVAGGTVRRFGLRQFAGFGDAAVPRATMCRVGGASHIRRAAGLHRP